MASFKSTIEKRLLNPIARSLGYEKRRGAGQPGAGFTLFDYRAADGTFDYQKYRAVQIEGNKRKLANTWVIESNIEFLSTYIKGRLGEVNLGLCHGTRRGNEQVWFRKYLGCEVIGTEISDTATSFPHTIQWDFHETKPEWLDRVDFIYSNSFDHSYDPEMCLNRWMSCVRPGGLCILEHSSAHSPTGATELDPFGADIVLMPYLIANWGKGRYSVREILDAPTKGDNVSYLRFLVITRTE